jgi:hypothetical protein
MKLINFLLSAIAMFAVAVAFVVLVIFDEQTIFANACAFWGAIL